MVPAVVDSVPQAIGGTSVSPTMGGLVVVAQGFGGNLFQEVFF